MTAPIYRRRWDERMAALRPLVGRQVELVINVHRLAEGPRETVAGELVSAAYAATGGAQDLYVVRTTKSRLTIDRAYSGATVEAVVVLDGEA